MYVCACARARVCGGGGVKTNRQTKAINRMRWGGGERAGGGGGWLNAGIQNNRPARTINRIQVAVGV